MKPIHFSKFKIATLTLVSSLLSMQQNCVKEDKTNPHAKVTIRLGGTFAAGETGTAYLDSAPIGPVSETQSVTKDEVSAGSHSVSVVTDKIPSTIAGSITKFDDTPISWTAPCEGATLIVTADPVYAVNNSTLFLSGSSKPIHPGQATTFANYNPGKNVYLVFIDQNGTPKYETTMTISYTTTYNIFIPYK